jgi:hypothetical protein
LASSPKNTSVGIRGDSLIFAIGFWHSDKHHWVTAVNDF